MKALTLFAIKIVVCLAFVHLVRYTQWQLEFRRVQRTSIVKAPELVDNNRQEAYLAVNEDRAIELKEQVRILCWVMTAPKNHWRKARHVKRTWGKRCNILLFMSSERDDRIPTIKVPSIEGYDNVWIKAREAFRYVYEHYKDQADWFLKADDDTYIVLENLRYYLSLYKPSDPYYFGHRYKAYVKNGYMQGGSGYVLSREALNRFVEVGLPDEKLCPSFIWPEDAQMGRCMDNLDCKGMDTRDAYGRDRFLPMTLQSHLGLGITDDTWFWDLHPSYYPIKKGFDCCSDTAIGFHQLSPAEMYLYDYLIYSLSPYGIEYIRAELQARPDLAPDAALLEPPFSGPSKEDLRWSAALVAREAQKMEQVQRMEEKAQLLDSNDTLRNEAWNNKKLNDNST